MLIYLGVFLISISVKFYWYKKYFFVRNLNKFGVEFVGFRVGRNLIIYIIWDEIVKSERLEK